MTQPNALLTGLVVELLAEASERLRQREKAFADHKRETEELIADIRRGSEETIAALSQKISRLSQTMDEYMASQGEFNAAATSKIEELARTASKAANLTDDAVATLANINADQLEALEDLAGLDVVELNAKLRKLDGLDMEMLDDHDERLEKIERNMPDGDLDDVIDKINRRLDELEDGDTDAASEQREALRDFADELETLAGNLRDAVSGK